MHSIEEPSIENNQFIIKRTKNGDSGMVHTDVLLPKAEDAEIKKVGGKGKEFWVFGTNYANDALPNRPDEANERGAWRVEVSPNKPSAENYFLNVMQVADNTCKELHEVKLLDADRIVGVSVADRIVTFSKDFTILSGKVAFTLDVKQNVKIVMTDMEAGNWQIRKDGQIFIPSKVVRSDDGILTFEGSSGHYELRR